MHLGKSVLLLVQSMNDFLLPYRYSTFGTTGSPTFIVCTTDLREANDAET